MVSTRWQENACGGDRSRRKREIVSILRRDLTARPGDQSGDGPRRYRLVEETDRAVGEQRMRAVGMKTENLPGAVGAERRRAHGERIGASRIDPIGGVNGIEPADGGSVLGR